MGPRAPVASQPLEAQSVIAVDGSVSMKREAVGQRDATFSVLRWAAVTEAEVRCTASC